MAAQEISIPNDLQPVLREFTKAVLRDMPEDVLLYSRDYFVEKAAQTRIASYQLPASTSRPFAELAPQLQQQIEDVFKRYDTDCDMGITIDELRLLMADLGGLFGFSEQVDASTLMALLDADSNNEISWQARRRAGPAPALARAAPRHRAACPRRAARRRRHPRRRPPPHMRSSPAVTAPRRPSQEWSHACAVWLADMGN